MKKLVFTLQFIFAFTAFTFAQKTQITQITTGAGYQSQSFFSFKNNTSKTIKNTDWDLAFTVYGQQDAGVFINEAAGTAAGQAVPNIELFRAPTDFFTDKINIADVKLDAPIYNNEKNKSWDFGAFNELRDPKKPFDYGWGTYSSGAQGVKSSKVFVVKLRDGKYRKIEIVGLDKTVYTVRHSALDGTDEKTFTVDKKNFAGKTLAYYSFATNAVVDLEPAGGYDMLFSRYISLITQGGVTAQYKVTGILSGRNVSAVKATGVDPKKVTVDNYKSQFSTQLDTIGVDWKSVDIATSKWTVPTDRAYFVKATDGKIYKMVFLDFEGSATGTATIEYSAFEVSTNDIANDIRYKVFPTVVNNEVNVMFDTTNEEDINISVYDLNGRAVYNQSIRSIAGLQVINIDTNDFANGAYIVKLSTRNGIAVSKIIK